jgi:DNA-binding IclR family transcriptional regulator
MPAYCTGLGKAILASMTAAALTAYLDRTELIAYTPNTIVDRDLLEKDLQEVKARGYAISNQEALLHQAGIGAPVLTSGGEVAGAVSTRLESVELGSAFMRTAADLLMRAANRISLEMGYQPMDMAHRSIQ